MTRTDLPARKLRQHPDLDQLKRQAKELLASYRDGDKAAAAEVSAYFRDADVATFALHDAQLVLARSYGFASWPKLKACLEGLNVQRLADAVRRGDIEWARAMLKARPELANMQMADNNEHRPIHYAVLARQPEMARLLMRHGADARVGIYPHRAATTALQLAIDRGFDEIVTILTQEEQRRQGSVSSADELTDALLARDVNQALSVLAGNPALINAVNRGGWTPLHVAAAMRNARVVEWLLAHGADANRKGPGDWTPLDHAVGRRAAPDEGFASVIRLLRQHAARTTARAAVAEGDAEWLRARHADGVLTNPIEDTGGLLTIAVRYNRIDILQMLLDFGFDPNERVRLEDLEEAQYSAGMPLWHAAQQGRYRMAELLLQRGADPNVNVYASGSSVYSAYSAGDKRMVELLRRFGGVVDPITVALFHEEEIAKQMLSTGARDAPPHDHYAGDTVAEHLLWGAACSGNVAILRAALEYVDRPRDDPHWYEMLDQPLRSWNRNAPSQDGFVECFRMILERCDPNIPHPRIYRTILHDVCGVRSHVPEETAVAFATLLLDKGARIDVRDELLRSTPLGWACRWGRAGLVKLLLARGADPVEADAEPWATPRAWAAKQNHAEILGILSGISENADGPVHE